MQLSIVDIQYLLVLEKEQDEGLRDRLILEVFYETGIRRSELIGMGEVCADAVTLCVGVGKCASL